MSLLTSIFVESISGAVERCKTQYDPVDGLELAFDVGSVLNEETLASLLCIVRGYKKFDHSVIKEIEFFDIASEGGSFLFKVPDEIVTRVRSAEIHDIAALSKRWKSTDPWFKRAGDDVTEEHLETTLVAMRDASIHAKQSGQSVLVYVST